MIIELQKSVSRAILVVRVQLTWIYQLQTKGNLNNFLFTVSGLAVDSILLFVLWREETDIITTWRYVLWIGMLTDVYRSQGDDNTYLDISDVHSNPPAPDIPKPFKSNSNGPIPSVRKHPPPPVPTKAKRTMSTENLNKLDLTKSLQSNSSQENRTSRTFSVVDHMRKLN